MNRLHIHHAMRAQTNTPATRRIMSAPQPLDPTIHVTPGPQGRWEMTDGILTWAWHRFHHRDTILARIDTTHLPQRIVEPLAIKWDALPCAYCGGPTLLQRPAALSPTKFAQWQRTTDAWIPLSAGKWTHPSNSVIACAYCHRAKGDQLLWHPDPSWIDTAPDRWNQGISQGWIHLASPIPAAWHHRTMLDLDSSPQPPLLIEVPLQRVWVDLDTELPLQDSTPIPDLIHVEPAFSQKNPGLNKYWRLTAGLGLWRQLHQALNSPTVIAIVDAVNLPLPLPGTRVQEHPMPHAETVLPCAYCGGPTWTYAPATMPSEVFQQYHRTIDHWIPRAAGGPNLRENRVIACQRCNQQKRDYLTWSPQPSWINEASHAWDMARQAGWLSSKALSSRVTRDVPIPLAQ